jgi:CGNR zinc finger/Putative stress-induced transcription regulator
MSQSWSASGRFGLVMAPGGAALVQDFLNTDAIGDREDLLSDPVSARRWADDAVQAWSAARGEELQPPALSTADLSELRVLRSQIASLLSGDVEGSAAVGGVSTSFGLSETGQVRLEPMGDGWQWLASALWGETLLSQSTDTWRRLKRCRNSDCQSTFYDRSKNNSGVWHNVKACGNAANLRASRARRRALRLSSDHE